MSADESVEFPIQTVVACEACGSEINVQWFCKNCPGSLCSGCRETHRTTNITKMHSVVPRTGSILRLYGPAKIAENCRIHIEREITTYCNECKVPCCVICHAEKHQRHEFSPIEEKYLTTEKRLNDYIKQLERETKVNLRRRKKQIKDNLPENEQRINQAVEDVNAFRKQIKDAVEDAFDILINKAQKPKKDATSLLTEIEKEEEIIDKLINECSDRIREGKLDLIEYIPPKPESFISTPYEPDLSYPQFIPGKELLNKIRNETGTIEYNYRFDKSMICSKETAAIESNVGATSIIMAGNNTAWIMHHSHDTMRLYSNSGKVVRSVSVKKGAGINDMAITPSGEMIVTNTDKKVRCVSVSGDVSLLIDTAPFYAQGVCLADRGEIVVCKRGQSERNHVAVYSSYSRKKLREIRCKDDQGKQLITSPYRVVQNGKDLCVVSGSNVLCVSERGDVRWVYDGTQAKRKWSFAPRGLCRDKHYNLLVTDHDNHCVHYIDRHGQLIQAILTKENRLYFHWGISVDDETDHVWVGNHYGQIVLTKYLK